MPRRTAAFFLPLALLAGCESGDPTTPAEDPLEIDRHERIPAQAVKKDPQTDLYPPVLHSEEFEDPVPLPPEVNTAGAEDSPFIPAGRQEIYFVFIKDASEPVEVQVRDVVNGIWVSRWEGGAWQEATLVLLHDQDELSLNGCQFVSGNEMLFCTARSGYTGLHWFRAEYQGDRWTNWQLADFPAEYAVGELHIHGDELYYHSNLVGGKGSRDIWMLTQVDGNWVNPTNVDVVNTEVDEALPYVTPDGQELWFTRWYQGSPAIFRSKRVAGSWEEPELIVSVFAGEPTLDWAGNLYFVHHFYEDGVLIEADIYVAYRK